MTTRIQTTFPQVPNKTICVMGDSMSHNYTLGVQVHLQWPELLAKKLRDYGCTVQTRNFAKSGATTSTGTNNMLGMFPMMFNYETPDMVIIFGGANDPGAGISNAQTQANLQAMIKWSKFNCAGVVANETLLPATAELGDRYVVMTDGNSTGGVAKLNSAPSTDMTTITGAGGNAQTVWQCRYRKAGVTGWGRVATSSTAPTHVRRIVLLKGHYLNFAASAGDNYNIDTGKRYNEGTSTDSASAYIEFASYIGVRAASVAAVAAENGNGCEVILADNFAYFSRLISSGIDVQGSETWHFSTGSGNQHFNAYGHSINAQAVYEKIVSTSGWTLALGASV